MQKDLVNDAEVLAVSDNGEKEQWGSNPFFFKDGGKWTLKTKQVTITTGIVFAALMIPQLFVEDPSVKTVERSKPTLNSDASPAIQSNSLEKYDPTERPAKVKGPRVVRLFTAPQVVARPRNVAIPPGAMVNAVLVSGASNGLVRAELTDSLIQSGETLLEEGAVLVGQGSSTEERLFVSFTQAVFRDGSIAKVEGQACDRSDKIVGLKGSKIGNKLLNIVGSIGLGFVGGFSEGLQETQGQQGVAVRTPSLKNALLNGTATTALEQSKALMSDLKDQKPIIEVQANEPICVIFGGGR
jgi:hypothetical protein